MSLQNRIKIHLAIYRSWKKWDKIVKGKGVDKGAANCDLCKYQEEMFEKNIGKISFEEKFLQNACYPCPLTLIGEKCGTEKSSYTKWEHHILINHIKGQNIPFNENFLLYREELGIRPQCPTCIEYAREMRKSLKNLLDRSKITLRFYLMAKQLKKRIPQLLLVSTPSGKNYFYDLLQNKL